MDYLFFFSLTDTEFNHLVISYDIACQWSIHLCEWMQPYPHHIQITPKRKVIIFLVPKFNLPAHTASCQTGLSFNLTPGVGQTDGEAPECGWANINPIATQTRQMGLT